MHKSYAGFIEFQRICPSINTALIRNTGKVISTSHL